MNVQVVVYIRDSNTSWQTLSTKEVSVEAEHDVLVKLPWEGVCASLVQNAILAADEPKQKDD